MPAHMEIRVTFIKLLGEILKIKATKGTFKASPIC